LVRGQHERDDLGLEAPRRRKQRTQRAIDDPAGQDLFLVGPALAAEEPTGDLPRRVGVLAVVDRQWKEVRAFTGLLGRDGGDQHDRVAAAHDHGPVGLLGHVAGLDREGLPSDLELSTSNHVLLQWEPDAPSGTDQPTPTARFRKAAVVPRYGEWLLSAG